MCLQCIAILNTKGLEAEAHRLTRMKTVNSGRRQFSSGGRSQLPTDDSVQNLPQRFII